MLGEILSAAMNFIGQQDANQTNMNINAANQNFQASQSATQYQRAVADMKAAGINPMLASQVGGNAAMSGSTTSVTSPMASAVSSAQAQSLLDAQVKKLTADTHVADTQATKNVADTALSVQAAQTSARQAENLVAQSALASVTYNKVLQEIDNIAANTGLTFAQTTKVKQDALNALLTGNNILADTGNKEADLKLKNLAIPGATSSALVRGSPVGVFGEILKQLNPLNSSASAASRFLP